MKKALCLVLAASLLGASPGTSRGVVPIEVMRQIPQGYRAISIAEMAASGREFYIVALATSDEEKRRIAKLSSPLRPLIIVEKYGELKIKTIGRNDRIVLKFDDGGRSGEDPFKGLAVKGSYFTVEHEVAGGIHWTYYITFRFDRRTNDFVFNNLRGESWSTNPNSDQDAEVLVSDGQHIEKSKVPLVPFNRWRPRLD